MIFLYIFLILILVYLLFILYISLKKKELNMFGFNFLKYLLKPIVKFLYPYKIINKKYSKVEGPVILAGNHLHIMDQCLPLIVVERPVHYMAKMEYFKNKSVSWFFKMAGCIPVNREIKDEHAKEESLNVLNEGKAFGIFPEGTRNALCSKELEVNKWYKLYENKITKEEFVKILKKNKVRLSSVNFLNSLVEKNIITKSDLKNNLLNANYYIKDLYKKNIITEEEYKNSLLLPFRFGAVSMAKKTNALILPFCITGNYKFRSKNLKVTFLKPFKITSDDLEKENKKLHDMIAETIMKEEMK